MQIEMITAVVLAGGKARRMGGEDKGLIKLNNKPLIEYVLEAIQPQVGNIIINANRNQSVYSKYGFPVVEDDFGEFSGPIAGMAAGIQAANTPYVVTVPCDSPYLASNLVKILYEKLSSENAEICTAYANDRIQPVFALIKKELLDSMITFLNDGERKIDKWFEKHTTAIADFSDQADMFVNINSPNELNDLELNSSEKE